ncbi:MAG TPA: DoxX family protein [Mucilaginibacter sp.]|nr:DoxX family protein [Mucilaginibacter sp.]
MTKTKKIVYWIATLWLSLGMISTGAVQLLKQSSGPGGAESMAHLGYPAYLMTLIGICKIAGVLVILMPGFRLLKEWAYAGFFFIMSGAIFSHIAVGDAVTAALPALLLLVLTVLSWYLRPGERKIISVNG